jgi:DNA-binding NarL/FixJ family response regulator
MRVLVVGVDPLARGGLARLLGDRPGLEVVAQAASADDWPALAAAHDAEAVAWDVGLSGGRVAELDRVRVPVLALVGDAEQAAEALAAGAQGVVARDADAERLEIGLQAVARGLIVVDEAFGESIRPRAAPASPMVEALTAREREVLQLLSEGLSNRRIAERLGISEHTAKFHVNAILGKLGAEGRTEAVVMAARLGLVTL